VKGSARRKHWLRTGELAGNGGVFATRRSGLRGKGGKKGRKIDRKQEEEGKLRAAFALSHLRPRKLRERLAFRSSGNKATN
jgi:hypothetical protein